MKKAVVLVENQYQDLEVWYPYLRLKEAGVKAVFAGTGSAKQYGSKHGYPVKPEVLAGNLKAKDWDAVIVPGGWAPDFLRRYPDVLKFVRDMDRLGNVVGSICHGGWVLASSGVAKGRTLTSFYSIRDDLTHAGARFENREVVVDRNLVTSRTPEDLPAFMREVLKLLKAR